jgi:hypothetical protein
MFPYMTLWTLSPTPEMRELSPDTSLRSRCSILSTSCERAPLLPPTTGGRGPLVPTFIRLEERPISLGGSEEGGKSATSPQAVLVVQ